MGLESGIIGPSASRDNTGPDRYNILFSHNNNNKIYCMTSSKSERWNNYDTDR